MSEMLKPIPQWGATLLITSGCIGAGMIGLPVVSASAGLIPTILAMVICYIFSTTTGLLLLEATLWFENHVNLISMADLALGKIGQCMTWLLFLFLFYCLFIAYIDGGGQLFVYLLSAIFHHPIPRTIGMFCCVTFVGCVVYSGTKIVSMTARLFLTGLIVSFCALLVLGIPFIEKSKLLITHWQSMPITLPILLICFGYQNLVPTITYYVKKNVKAACTAIFIGNLLPFFIYCIWNVVILGLLPQVNTASTQHNTMVTDLLETVSTTSSVFFYVQVFSFFAILNPFMANMLSFIDFLKDGLPPLKYKHDLYTYSLTFIPPTLLSILYPHLFLKALSIAGGFVDMLLFGVLPVLIVWKGRYIQHTTGSFKTPGGKFLLILIFLFSISILSMKIISYF